MEPNLVLSFTQSSYLYSSIIINTIALPRKWGLGFSASAVVSYRSGLDTLAALGAYRLLFIFNPCWPASLTQSTQNLFCALSPPAICVCFKRCTSFSHANHRIMQARANPDFSPVNSSHTSPPHSSPSSSLELAQVSAVTSHWEQPQLSKSLPSPTFR